MTQSKILNEDQVKKLHQLENMALMLDKGCQAGELDDANVEKAQAILNKTSEALIAASDVIGSRLYIVYENQAMLHWIDGNEDDARDFANIARRTKGVGDLLTKTANDLLGNAKVVAKIKPVGPDAKLVGLNGWFAWISVGIILSAVLTIVNIVSLISASSQYFGNNYGWFFYFELFAGLALIVLAILYLVYLSKRSKKAKTMAIIFIIGGFLISVIDSSIASSIYTSVGASIPADMYSDASRSLVSVLLWVPYFLISRRVKLTLIND